MSEYPEKLEYRGQNYDGDAIIDVDGNYFAEIMFLQAKNKLDYAATAAELVRRWNEHDSLKAKADSQPALLDFAQTVLNKEIYDLNLPKWLEEKAKAALATAEKE